MSNWLFVLLVFARLERMDIEKKKIKDASRRKSERYKIAVLVKTFKIVKVQWFIGKVTHEVMIKEATIYY